MMRENRPLMRAGSSADNDSSTLLQKNLKKKQNLYRHIIYRDAIFFPSDGDRLIESPIFSNLTLQKFMYFNIYFDILFFYLMAVTFLYKLYVMDMNAFHIVKPILLVPWALVEAFRFHSGYTGNLKETFPDLFTFNLLTLGSIGLVIAYAIFPKRLPIELACYIIFLIFGFIELIVGYYVMFKLSVSQEALFYLRSANSQIRMKKEAPASPRSRELELSRLQTSNEDEGPRRRRLKTPTSYAPLVQDERE